MADTLNYIFNICIIIGFVIPLLNLVTGWLGSFFGGGMDVDIDASADFSMDAGTDFSLDASADISLDVGADIGLDASADVGVDVGAETNAGSGGVVPFNMMCFCLFLVVFGALGHMTKGLMTTPLFIVLLLSGCLVLASLSYWALYNLVIKRLKQNDASALAYRDLRGKSAEVTLRITADSIGTISVSDSTGAPISFRAKMDPDLKERMNEVIPQGESVIITDIDIENKICFVSVPFSKFSNEEKESAV